MKTRMRWLHLGLVATGLLAGCSSGGSADETVTGTVALPLVTYGPSGTTYRLRNAVFELTPYQYYYGTGTGGATGTWNNTSTGGANWISSTFTPSVTTGTGGANSTWNTSTPYVTTPGTRTTPGTGITTRPTTNTSPTPVVVVNSEDQPDAESITVELEQGEYRARLLPGWSMEKSVNGAVEPVEAQLLSGDTQWIWVSRQATSWVSYQFGIGSHELWFNGNVNINIQVYENPGQYYGGTSPYPATGGSPSTYPATGGSTTTSPRTWNGTGGVAGID